MLYRAKAEYALVLLLPLLGCKYTCSKNEIGQLACMDNEVVLCTQYSGSWPAKWVPYIKCGKYGATCKKDSFSVGYTPEATGVVPEDSEYFFYDAWFDWPPTHGCVFNELDCDTDTAVRCNETEGYAAQCDYSLKKPAPVIVSRKRSRFAARCMEKRDGTAEWVEAYADGQCVEGESACSIADSYVVACEDTYFTEIVDRCSSLELMDCSEYTDGGGGRQAQCAPVVPCDESIAGINTICLSTVAEDYSETYERILDEAIDPLKYSNGVNERMYVCSEMSRSWSGEVYYYYGWYESGCGPDRECSPTSDGFGAECI